MKASEYSVNTQRIETMEALLNAAFACESLEIIDDSHKHAGHAGAKSGGGHFDLTIVAAAFDGLNTVARHRLIYETLGEMMKTDIHALSIKAYAPAEI